MLPEMQCLRSEAWLALVPDRLSKIPLVPESQAALSRCPSRASAYDQAVGLIDQARSRGDIVLPGHHAITLGFLNA
jgi:hypothetical protein